MYTSTTRRVGAATSLRQTQKGRARRLIASTKAPPSLEGGTGVRVFSRDAGSAAEAGGGQGGGLWSNVKARSRLSVLARGVPSASSVAGAVALIPVVGGVWFVSVFALRQRLCEHHLQQVEGTDSAASKDRRRRSRNGSGGGSDGKAKTPPLYPGSSADARGLREMLEVPARGVTVLCVDPPASYTGDAFVRSALMGRAATVHIRAGEGDGALPACLARGLGVEFMTTKLQMSALLPGMGGDRGWNNTGETAGTPGRELNDIRAVLETATAALEEIRSQAADPRHHLPPVIVIDGLLGRIRAGENVPAAVEAVLRWSWTITGGRRLAHVVLTAPQSMTVDGSLVRVKGFLNDGRLSPGMMRVVALNTPDRRITERRFRARFAPPQPPPPPRQPPSTPAGPLDNGSGGVAEADGAGGGEGGGAGGERAVELCMELVHEEGCGVAEEANEILRRVGPPDDGPRKKTSSSSSSSSSSPSSYQLSLDEALDGIALEAWRRVAAAVMATPSHPFNQGEPPRLSSAGSGGGSAPTAATAAAAAAAAEAGVDGARGNAEASKRREVAERGGASSLRQLGRGRDELIPGFLLDDFASLEAVDLLGREAERAGEGGECGAVAAAADGSPGKGGSFENGFGVTRLVAAPPPSTPLECLVGLIGQLADGGKVSVEHALAALNGDGKALGRLLDLGVLRLCPQTISDSLGAAQVARVSGITLPSSTRERAKHGDGTLPSDVLAEAGVAFQVRAATPIMAGVFAILRGCKGTEEQEIARAMNVLRGGNPGGFLSELSEREEWQAQREAVMASLVRRALLVHGDGQWRGGAERGVGGRLAVSSRSLQAAMAAVGCMATRSEIDMGLSIMGPQTGFAVAAMLPGLLRTHRRMLPGTSPAMVESSGHLDDSDESTAIAEMATDKSAKGDRVTSDSIGHQSGVGDDGGGEGLYGNKGSSLTAVEDTMSDASVSSGVEEGKGLAVPGDGKSTRGSNLGVKDDGAPMRSLGDEDGKASSSKGEGINQEGREGEEAGRSYDAVDDTAIPGRNPAFSRRENREAPGGRDGVSHVSQAREKGLPVGPERQSGVERPAVSETSVPDAAGNIGKAPDEGTPAAKAAAGAAEVSSVHASHPGDGSEIVGDRTAAGQRVDAVGGLELAAQSKSDPSTQAGQADQPTVVPAAPMSERAQRATVDSAAGNTIAAVVAGEGEEEVKTPRANEADPSNDGAATVRSEGEASAGNDDANGRQVDENAPTQSTEKPPTKSTWGWGLPAWAGGGKNNGAR